MSKIKTYRLIGNTKRFLLDHDCPMAGLLFYRAVKKPALFVILGEAKNLNYLKIRDSSQRPE
jgi:hypothetical protein